MLDKDMIRHLIRDVIAEEVRNVKAGKLPPQSGDSVSITSDADLAAFARRVLELAEDPKIRAAIASGRHPFHLAGGAPADATAPTPQSHRIDTHRIDKGVVTESAIAKLPKGTTRLVLGPGVSITPLARDKAKARNISIERVRP